MSRSRLAVLLPLVIALAVSAPAASASPLARAAATCSDYSNQADAQRAADTRDPDHDGIYCESLPCPCLKPGSGHHRDRKPALFHGKCKRGRLPDKHCTPGRAFHGVTADDVCTPGYSATVRHVTAKTKRRVCKEYGIRRHHRGQYEIDHLIPLELGGSNSIKNLFPEAVRPRPGFHQKDKLENRLHDEVCDGTITLHDAQHQIKTNWLKALKGAKTLFGHRIRVLAPFTSRPRLARLRPDDDSGRDRPLPAGAGPQPSLQSARAQPQPRPPRPRRGIHRSLRCVGSASCSTRGSRPGRFPRGSGGGYPQLDERPAPVGAVRRRAPALGQLIDSYLAQEPAHKPSVEAILATLDHRSSALAATRAPPRRRS